MVQPAFVVYFAAGSGELPTADAAAAALRKAGLLSIGIRPAVQLPPLPIELLQHMGLGELEERIARSATNVVLVVAKDLNMPPRAGLWAALAAALAVRDLPPNLDKLSIFMNAVAQYLVEATFREVTARKASVDRLELPAEISVDRALVARALRQKDDNAPTDDGRVTAVLRFDSDQSTSRPPMIRIERPPSFAGDTGVWLNELAGTLLGQD